ncbi:class I glutamine amidotransferase-like protein [Flagelloscypha sp. PMI_526]|nr:class I glutamine amidotransferase-like protein [Flagelloscypha sp. PMI_526]
MPKLLFIFSSAGTSLLGRKIGWFLPEAAHPYAVLAPHFEIDFASPQGPNPPVDPLSVEMFKDEDSLTFLNDRVIQEKLANAKKIIDVKAEDYDGIFYVGGHGPILDIASMPENAMLASKIFQAGKITAAICHGPGALVGAVDKDGKSIFKGRKFTGLSNREEELFGTVLDIPFSLEDRIISLGGLFECAEPQECRVVVSDNLYTGQNPASGKLLGQEILKALQK